LYRTFKILEVIKENKIMDLPDGTAITAAGTFLGLVWDANPMLATLFALVAILTVGFYALRRARSVLPK
jgi:hypothetical protein